MCTTARGRENKIAATKFFLTFSPTLGRRVTTLARMRREKEEKDHAPVVKVTPARIGTRLPEAYERVLDERWASHLKVITDMPTSGPAKPDFKLHADLPLSRVKRVMKSDGAFCT